jgi:putative ABC transport system permease protein
MIKIEGRNLPETIAFIQGKWKQLAPGTPFDYRFLDDDYLKLYYSEAQLGKVMNLFSAIAIILGCLGLFGLSSYIGQQRTKEIGIRKILGASPWSIIGLLSLTFARPLLFSILIAIPLAWWQMEQWLGNFAYRIELQWWVFGTAGFSAMAVALLTVSVQSINAASTNPVDSLKSE